MRKLARFTHFLLKRHRAEWSLLLSVSALISAAEAFLQPYLIKLIFDEAVGIGNMGYLLQLAGYYLAGGGGVIIFGYGADLWERSLQNRVVKSVTTDLLAAYYRKDYKTVLAGGEGYFVGRVYRDAFEGLSPAVPLIRRMANSVVMMVVFLAMLFYLSWQGALFLIAAMPVVAYVSRVFGKKIEEVTGHEREHEGAVLSTLNRCLAAFKFARIGPLREKALGTYGRGMGKFLETVYRNHKLAAGYGTVTSLGMVGADFLAVVVGAAMVIRGALSFGGYIAFVNVFWRAVSTVMGFFRPLAEVHRLGAIADRIQTFLETTPPEYFTVGESVELREITLAYNAEPVLRSVNLAVRPRERVLVLGPNGAGKTTLANILAGYLAPNEGQVTLPARRSAVTIPIEYPPVRVRDLPVRRDLLGVFSLKGIEDELAENLSAGQKQKLAIAVALSQDADLYVFDEPLSNVDVMSADTVMEKVMELTRGKAAVVIMHGGEKYHHLFDRVLALDGGEITASR